MAKNIKKNVGAILHSKGVTFRVWAPFAESAAVTGAFNNWSETPLENENDGYWATEVRDAKAGQEYKYVIKNGEKILRRNDPRALQLTTSAGNSVIVDTSFDWQNDDFTPIPFNKQVIYEMHIGTFHRKDPASPGTFQTAMEKLDYLANLGINMIELMPINSMWEDRGWGYAPDYIYAVESLYGGRHQFMEFVRAAHQKGIGVILDIVYNHFAPDEKLDLWQFDGWHQDNRGGIYFYNDWRAETPWGSTRPDFGRLEVRQYITDNVTMWLSDCHIDGLRLDSTIYLRNVKGHNDDPANDIPEGWWLLQNITTLGRKIKPGGIFIAEDSSGNEYITKPADEGGAGFSSQWEITFPGTIRQALNAINDSDRNLAAICDIMQRHYNGDVFQRIVYSESHDNDANGGQRLSEEVSPGNAGSVFARKRSLLAAAMVLTAPGIPMLFQGQEFVQNGSFNDWQALEWERTDKFAGIVLAHSHLIALRKNTGGYTTGLTGQGFNVLHLNDANKVLAYHRWMNGGAGDDTVVILNFENREQKNYVINFPQNGTWHIRFNSAWDGYSADFKTLEAGDVEVENYTGSIDLAPYCVLILSQDI